MVSSGNLTPFGKGRRSIDFEVLAAAKMTFLVKIVADRSVDRNEFLERFGAPDFCHRALSLPERLVENLGPIVPPATGLLALGVSDDPHRRRVGPEPIRHDHLGRTIAFHCAPQKLERSLAIPPFRGKHLEHFAFMIDRPPEVMCLAIEPHEHLVQVPAPQ